MVLENVEKFIKGLTILFIIAVIGAMGSIVPELNIISTILLYLIVLYILITFYNITWGKNKLATFTFLKSPEFKALLKVIAIGVIIYLYYKSFIFLGWVYTLCYTLWFVGIVDFVSALRKRQKIWNAFTKLIFIFILGSIIVFINLFLFGINGV